MSFATYWLGKVGTTEEFEEVYKFIELFKETF
jgi:hypothetical protein